MNPMVFKRKHQTVDGFSRLPCVDKHVQRTLVLTEVTITANEATNVLLSVLWLDENEFKGARVVQ